jgi:magnesium transporter
MPDDQKQLLQQVEPLLEADDKASLASLLADERSSDIAEIIEILDNDAKRVVFDVLDKEAAAEVLEKLSEATRATMFDLLEDHELRGIILELGLDDAADLLAELSEEECQQLLDGISAATATRIRKLMSYTEDSAGGIMDPVLISVRQDASVSEAVSKIRAAEIDEDFYSVFAVDDAGRFVGDVRIRLLLTSHEDRKINDLLDTDTIYVEAEADQEEVRNIFSKNDLIVAPVLDKQHRLIGRITADRIIEVAEEEAAEDLYAMAGTDPEELDKVSVLHAARIRMTWLLPCLAGTAITTLVLIFFHKTFTLENFALIFTTAVAFVPMIAAISGNAGLQTSAIVVSGLATGHLAAQKLGQVFSREVRIALLVALSCGIVGGLACAVLLHFRSSAPTIDIMRLVFAFGVAMFSAIMVATTLGLFLPFLFRRIGIDPAISSGPLVTTANDSISVAIYMTLTLLLVGATKWPVVEKSIKNRFLDSPTARSK